ncbi:MAG: hypothetical protein FWH29_07195 [Methanobrevibacter sp.]|nr:hypothetical protein [Methanobrevibacter sp.]
MAEKYGKTIHIQESQRRWAIVIMPDEIKIDNYHRPAHIHMELDGIHIPTKYNDLETIG